MATIGPVSEKKVTIRQMMTAGLNAARLNFSHNVHRHHLMLIKNIRQAAKELRLTVAIIGDLQGPRIRIGDVGEGIKVVKNQEVVLIYSLKKDRQPAKPAVIPIHYENLYRDLKKGERILIEDGLIELKVAKIIGRKIHCSVVVPGTIKTHKGMNFPQSRLRAKALTAKDLSDLDFAVKNGVDFVALSFVKDEKDISDLRKKIVRLEKKYKLGPAATKIVAKIERREAVKNFERILKAADAVMVARGDLGIELPFEEVPLIQKKIIARANFAGKPVIVATQMLDSMIRNPLPTRAEVSDVANAVLDGADAIMLSGESATGLYPLQAVKVMKKIADQVEPTEFKIQQDLEHKIKRIKSFAEFIAFSVQDNAEKIGAKAIICLTKTGEMVRMIVRYKSKVPLLAFSPFKKIANQLALSWGVSAFYIDFPADYRPLWLKIKKYLLAAKKLKKGDQVLVCAGRELADWAGDNFIRLEKI